MNFELIWKDPDAFEGGKAQIAFGKAGLLDIFTKQTQVTGLDARLPIQPQTAGGGLNITGLGGFDFAKSAQRQFVQHNLHAVQPIGGAVFFVDKPDGIA